MANCIDREAFKSKYLCCGYLPEMSEAEFDSFPAADVAPVVHGRWNADETCSLCGEKSTEGLDATKWDYWLPNYCPNCGAKMKGVSELDG